VLKPDNSAELRVVTLGQRQGEDVVVTKGIADGERVVVTGQLTVAPGGKVRVQEAGPANAPPGAAPPAQSADPGDQKKS